MANADVTSNNIFINGKSSVKHKNIVPKTTKRALKDKKVAEDLDIEGTDISKIPKDELRLLISDLENDMKEAAAKLDFERAASLRDQIATLKGLNKLLLNEDKFAEDLEKNWAVVAEAIQTILRREAYPNPYEALKGLTRTNEAITKDSMHAFIATLEVSDAIKAELLQITPSNFIGI